MKTLHLLAQQQYHEVILNSNELVLVERSKQLEKSFKEAADQLREQVENHDSRFDLAKEKVAGWRRAVKQLTQLIDAQLKYCESLRDGETLQSLIRESPEAKATKQSHQFMKSIKSDMRLLHEFHENMLEKEKLLTQEPHVETTNEAHRVEFHNREIKGSECEANAKKLEDILMKHPVYGQRRKENENDEQQGVPTPPGSMNQGNGFQHPKRTITKIPNEEMHELVSVYQGQLCDILAHLLKKKTDLDALLGIKYEAGAIVVGMHKGQDRKKGSLLADSRNIENSSNLTKLVLQLAGSMEHLLGVAMQLGYMREGADIAQELQGLREENILLKSDLTHEREQVNLLETALNSIKQERNGLVPNHMHGKQLLRVEEARQHLMKLETEYRSVQRHNALLLLENGQLKDTLAQLSDEVTLMTQKYDVESAWFQPRLKKLEEMVIATASSFDSMALDVELITKMYLGTCDKLKKQVDDLHRAKEEEVTISTKFRKLIKMLQEEKTENARKDKVIAALMGTRHEMSKSVKEMQAKQIRAEEQLAQAQKQLEQRIMKLEQVEQENVRLREATQKADKSHAELFQQLNALQEQYESEKANHEKKVKRLNEQIDSLKTLGMDKATREAYDEMQLRLKHAIAAYQKLEAKLNNKPLR